MSTIDLAQTIDAAWEDRANVSPSTKGAVREAVEQALALLDAGEARVAEPRGDGWHVNQWLKKAVLLSFRLNDNAAIPAGPAAPIGGTRRPPSSPAGARTASAPRASAPCRTATCAAAPTLRPAWY